MPKGESTANSETTGIEHLRLVGKRQLADQDPLLIIEAFPKWVANEINRSVFGGSATQALPPISIADDD
jgi:hypothetical protein